MRDWNSIPPPIVGLAPMADMTDSAFCRIAKRFGAAFVFREMVSADALVHGNGKTLATTAFHEEERPIIQQIFGTDPGRMAEAVRILDEGHAPDAFDINMGCPVYKIVSNFNGAALMRDAGNASSIVRAMKEATARPVSVKTRLGWSRPDEILEFVKVLVEAGADMVTVHGRTKTQGYGGSADWDMVGRAKARVRIPVLVNGDIFSADDAKRALAVTGCNGCLIARGALGRPWIFREIAAVLTGSAAPAVSDAERTGTIMAHAGLHADLHGDLVAFRKHLAWYVKGLPGATRVRGRLAELTTVDDLRRILEEEGMWEV